MTFNSTEIEINALYPANESFNRRGFLQTGIACGFAAAAGPVLAQQAIKTDSTGLTAGTVHLGADKIPAYRAKPAQGSGFATVVVVSEIFGAHEYIQDTCRRFAKLGYYAIAPEFFVRQGDVTRYPNIPELIKEVISKTPDAQVMADIDSAVKFASGDGADTKRLGITGFCWGGRIVWLYSAHNPALKAGVAWYGRLVEGFNPGLNPNNPLTVAGQLHAPVLGLYGEQDSGIPLAHVEQMKAALAQAGGANDKAAGNAAARASEFVVYPGAPHAFHADYRPSYRKEAAEDGWQRLQAWFKKYGV